MMSGWDLRDTESERVSGEKSKSVRSVKKWMEFWIFDFVFNQNKADFNGKLEPTNTGLSNYFM